MSLSYLPQQPLAESRRRLFSPHRRFSLKKARKFLAMFCANSCRPLATAPYRRWLHLASTPYAAASLIFTPQEVHFPIGLNLLTTWSNPCAYSIRIVSAPSTPCKKFDFYPAGNFQAMRRRRKISAPDGERSSKVIHHDAASIKTPQRASSAQELSITCRCSSIRLQPYSITYPPAISNQTSGAQAPSQRLAILTVPFGSFITILKIATGF